MITPKRPVESDSSFSGLYTSTFLAVGVALGAALESIGLWLPAFLSIGLALDYGAPQKKAAEKTTDSASQSDQDKTA
jgi:hypothetical protein